ncbi:hypothetical protein QBC46DRAFT_292063, partial [Diplogelasinospora grovesii]
MKAFVPFLLALASIDAVLAARPLGRHRRGQDATESATPAYEYDPATTKDCVWWLDVVENFTCQQVVSIYGVAIEDFIRWNPSLQESCTTLLTLHSYCVAATDSYHSGAPATTKTATTVTTATTTSATATTGTNGVATPLPTQPGMTKDCNKFALVRSGDTCDSVCKANGISEGDLYDMNSQVNNGSADCDNLWADAYVCVGSSGTTTSAAGTGAGAVATPSPYQPGMTDRCRQFYKVEPGMDCRRISDAYHITVGEFIAWNPAAGADCRGLWAGYYCCVAI